MQENTGDSSPLVTREVVRMKRILFEVACAVAGLLAYVAAYALGTAGNPLVFLMPIIISPVCMLIIRVTMERGRPAGILSPKTQSWSFLFGDSIALPFAFAMSALGWESLNEGAWYATSWWYALGIVAGFAVACFWHFRLEVPAYTKMGHADRLKGYTKLWHDFPVYGAISGSLLFLGVPVLIHDFTGYGWLALLGLLLWGGFAACDATFRRLDPANLHPTFGEVERATQALGPVVSD